jgi:U4/U6 small nuclear ribonucleoprotein PRP3
MIYRILYLANPIHKSKVRNNAQQDGLTGVVLYHEKFCLVVVEGGMKGLKHFKHLMLSRIDWTEEIRSRNADAEDGEGDENNEDGTPAVEGAKPVELNAEGEPINQVVEPQSLVDNKCTLVWEGTHRERMFRPAGNGGLRQANCPTETAAKEFLGTRFEGLWDVAKKMDESED